LGTKRVLVQVQCNPHNRGDPPRCASGLGVGDRLTRRLDHRLAVAFTDLVASPRASMLVAARRDDQSPLTRCFVDAARAAGSG
jgi:hypothetical protein